MNHGGLGYLSEHRLVLPVDLLRPLSIGDESSIIGLYYPKRQEAEYEGLPDCHDLMLTPIPIRYWPVMGRFLVRLRHYPGTMAAVAEWLRKQEISILNAECSRSAHRYATWNLTIAFDSLLNKSNNYDSTASDHIMTRKALRKLAKEILLAFPGNNILFRDNNDTDLKNPVEALPVRAHSYFYNYLMTGLEETKGGPIELYCSYSQLQSRDQRLAGLLDRIESEHEFHVPTCVFAETDTRDFNIRVAIMNPAELHRFYEVVIPYRRSGGQSTRGLVATVTKNLSTRYNIWRLFNSTSQNGEDVESGEVIICVEDTDRDNLTRPLRRENIEHTIRALKAEYDNHGCRETKILNDYYIEPITPNGVYSRLMKDKQIQTGTKYDVFLSYGKRDGKVHAARVKQILEERGLQCHLDEIELKPGEIWIPRLVENIKQSAEVAVVCTRRSLDRPFIAMEIGCALSLDKYVTPILCGDIEENEIPEYLRRFQWTRLRGSNRLEEYCASVIKRTARATRF